MISTGLALERVGQFFHHLSSLLLIKWYIGLEIKELNELPKSECNTLIFMPRYVSESKI